MNRISSKRASKPFNLSRNRSDGFDALSDDIRCIYGAPTLTLTLTLTLALALTLTPVLAQVRHAVRHGERGRQRRDVAAGRGRAGRRRAARAHGGASVLRQYRVRPRAHLPHHQVRAYERRQRTCTPRV